MNKQLLVMAIAGIGLVQSVKAVNPNDLPQNPAVTNAAGRQDARPSRANNGRLGVALSQRNRNNSNNNQNNNNNANNNNANNNNQSEAENR